MYSLSALWFSDLLPRACGEELVTQKTLCGLWHEKCVTNLSTTLPFLILSPNVSFLLSPSRISKPKLLRDMVYLSDQIWLFSDKNLLEFFFNYKSNVGNGFFSTFKHSSHFNFTASHGLTLTPWESYTFMLISDCFQFHQDPSPGNKNEYSCPF